MPSDSPKDQALNPHCAERVARLQCGMQELIPNLYLLMLVFILAGLVKGITGMGLPTVAMALLGGLLTPSAAAAMLVAPSLVTNIWQIFAGPATVQLLQRLWPMLLMLVFGTVCSVELLVRTDPLWSSMALGLALLGYAIYVSVAPRWAFPQCLEYWLSPLVGLVTGITTGATGIFVMPVVPYLQALGLSKDELVQALGLSFTISTIALALGLLMHGAFQPGHLGLSALAIVPALLGMWLGQVIRVRISQQRFRQLFLFFLVVLALELISRPFI